MTAARLITAGPVYANFQFKMPVFNSVLIVEDDPGIREVLRDVIALEGYKTLEAENGRIALDLLSSGKVPGPCLILLDLMMPELNGWDFLEIRRKTDAIATIPTIVLTAVQGGKLPTGATKVLKKPINLIELISAIDSYCGKDLTETIDKTKSVA